MIRLLVFMLAFLSYSASAQSDRDLVDRFDRLYNADRLEQALATAEAIIKRYPDSAWWRFNTGAVLAKLDRGDEAMVHLHRCAELGFSGIRSFEQNSDLDGLRERADFAEVLGIVRENAERRMDEFKREAERHKPRVFIPEGVESPCLIIALHGTGMDGDSMYDALLPAASELGMALVCPDALRPSGDGFSWTYRDESQWFVEHLIERSVAEHGVHGEKVILVGFSQGANIALIMGQTRPEKFIGTIPICGHYEEQIAESDDTPAPCYLLTGARDPWRKTYGQAKRNFEAAGGAAQVRMVSGMGHELPDGAVGKRELMRALRWVLRQAEE